MLHVHTVKWDSQGSYILSAAFAAVLFAGARLFSEKRRLSRAPFTALWAFVLLAVVIYYWFVSSRGPMAAGILFGHVFVGSVCLGLVAPFLDASPPSAFWTFLYAVAVRFLLTILYSTAILTALSIALVSAHILLGVEVSRFVYADLGFFLCTVFSSWFFFAGVPVFVDSQVAPVSESFPKWLRIFSQFVLIPTVVLYVGILYLYAGKIALARTWPQGTVGFLVIVAGAVWTLTVLVLNPLANSAYGNTLLRLEKWIYRAMVPLSVLLILAAQRRISEYGLTEERYALVGIALWIMASSLFYGWSKKIDIRLIPLSLGALAFICVMGPWGSLALSFRSQRARLEALVPQQALAQLASGLKTPNNISLDLPTRKTITSILKYLFNTHGVRAVERSLKVDRLNDLGGDRYHFVENIMSRMGIQYAESWTQDESYRSYGARFNKTAYDVKGFDFLLRSVHFDHRSGRSQIASFGEKRIQVTSPDRRTINFSVNGRSLGSLTLKRILAPVKSAAAATVATYSTVDPGAFVFDIKGEAGTIRLFIDFLSTEVTSQGELFSTFTADLAIHCR